MRFEFKLRIGPLAIELSDWDNFVPFQLTVWRYNGTSGHSVCNIRWGKFSWHGWKDKAPIILTCTPRIVSVSKDEAGRFNIVDDDELRDQWDDVIGD